jgi:hypothetical protein
VLILASVMFAFIGYWRTSAVVLCDLSSTAYYIGGIVESQIGKAAPWFILAVMLFSYCVRSFYIESCSMFVRGGSALVGGWRTPAPRAVGQHHPAVRRRRHPTETLQKTWVYSVLRETLIGW